MKITCHIRGIACQADLDRPIDLSIPLVPDAEGPNAYGAPVFRAEPVRAGSFVGDTRLGGSVNFMDVRLNPHGNGTHTECYGHIATERVAVNDCLKRYHFTARLLTLYPTRRESGDLVIEREQLTDIVVPGEVEAIILRTMPNGEEKARRQWTGTNPPYLDAGAVDWLVHCGVEHVLVDLPSVDREDDGGVLAAHHVWWGYPDHVRVGATITEMIYVPDFCRDGLYLLNLQIAPFVLDASPSKPLIYPLTVLP
ncbi:MAG: cyclase family protein [Lewinellaceae bacterium]|nr:cyclase family protein [Saprospiraceae bacterium]MCB9312535.1 cyclase family protein [Lewinellaceae bacterium]